ncbi:Cleavage/polyadenylation specificity factor, A subunit, C-terminal [Kalmanozyma brasiliensis GHG001]|uniref:DNA damage-binding protein 1 n=1 Tax=Kalmanozyma brasiliensis (strain GHG001) TaxID=1365824 RepID=V5ER33_KALBG|nr:Cleavage/polyadenylation specificity factor, A subunit, C-terminal [Kalmanozyma brasiliensis GHG001]EST05408.1 Cleavage/polyadenylation specificity factor, A subunit, C-terminal [Kalmanozyma brasiliensis GHG001]
MLYLAHAYEASAVLQTLPLASFLPTGPCLAVVKHSTVEFLSLATGVEESPSSAAGLLDLVQTVSLHARILSVQAVTDPSSSRQTLLVLTDHYRPRLISLASSVNPKNGEVIIETTATLALDEVARSPAESALGIWTEPFSPTTIKLGQRIALSHVYKGVAKVVPMPASTASTNSEVADDADEIMHDVSSTKTPSPGVQFSQSFSVRLPHPNLLSCAVLSPMSQASVPAVALLSQSSVPSKIPGFGEQCLPVLSFHSVHVSSQDFLPMPWGPPRKPPRSGRDDDDDKRLEAQSSSAATQASRDIKAAKNDDKSSARKKHGPAAMGSKASIGDLRKREEDYAKTDLAHCHVPLPHADAVGAHYVHALPAHVGGGVLVFSENSILYVPPPTNPPTSTTNSESADPATEASDAKGKRRKASEGGSFEPRRRSSGAAQARTSPAKTEQVTTAATPTPSNENGKRRRSSVNVPTSGAETPSNATTSSSSRPRLFRVGLPHPVQVVSVVDIGDASPSQTTGTIAFSVAFACHSGALNVLRLTMPDGSESSPLPLQPKSIRVETLGHTSQPAGSQALSYLGDGLVCVASATGDSCIYKIQEHNASDDAASSLNAQVLTPPSSPTEARRRRPSQAIGAPPANADLPSGGSLGVVETWQCLGPVVDFVVDDGAGGDPTSSSGAQARIVTCSGAGPSGSIREARSGASVQDVTSLPIPNAQQIWPVHSGDDAAKYSMGVLVAFATSTAYLHFDANGDLADATERLAAAGPDLSLPTIAAATVLSHNQGPLLLRIARTEASLVSFTDDNITSLHKWTPPAGVEVTAASANATGQLILALSDKTLLYFLVEGGTLVQKTKAELEHEVSCTDISALVEDKAAQIVACGFWKTRSFQIFSLPDLAPVGQASVVQQHCSAVPRSILLHRFASKQSQSPSDGQTKASLSNRDALTPHLLIGLGDGTLISYSLSLPTKDSYSKTVGLFDAKTVSLGTQALKLDALETSAGARVVAVSGSRPTLVFADSKRFSYNALKYKDQRSVATLHAGPGRVFAAFALSDSIELASIGALRQRDIRTFPLGLNQPLAIAQWANRKVFAVCTWEFLPLGTATRSNGPRGAVRILDHTTFEVLDEIRLEPDERPNCITVLRAQGHEMLVVGTGFVTDQTHETTHGRLVGFDVSSGSSRTKEERGRLRKFFEHDEKGNVYSVQSINNRLAAAVNSEVKIYSVVDPRPSDVPAPRIKVRQRGSWASSFIACNLSVIEPDRIVVGDALRSMNVLHVHPYTARLTEIARDCDPFWSTATELLDDESQTYIGADISFNLYTTQRVPLSEEVKARIRRAREQEMERSVNAVDPRTTRDPNEVDRYAHVMQRNAVWHYGDMINKFCRRSLVPDPGPNAAVRPRLLFCTAAGAIGVIAHVRDDEARLLAKVERNILSLIASTSAAASAGVVGNIAHSDWRTLRTDHRVQAPAGFLDANVLQKFVDGRLDRQERDKVVTGPNSEVEALGVEREVVEQLIEALSQVC